MTPLDFVILACLLVDCVFIYRQRVLMLQNTEALARSLVRYKAKVQTQARQQHANIGDPSAHDKGRAACASLVFCLVDVMEMSPTTCRRCFLVALFAYPLLEKRVPTTVYEYFRVRRLRQL